MKITYDNSVDAAYIYLMDESTKSAKTYMCDPLEVEGMINIDFDTNGQIIGIEVMDASKKLSSEVLNQAR